MSEINKYIGKYTNQFLKVKKFSIECIFYMNAIFGHFICFGGVLFAIVVCCIHCRDNVECHIVALSFILLWQLLQQWEVYWRENMFWNCFLFWGSIPWNNVICTVFLYLASFGHKNVNKAFQFGSFLKKSSTLQL